MCALHRHQLQCPSPAPLNLCHGEGQPLAGPPLGSGFVPRRIPKGCLWEERALLWWMVRSPGEAPQAQRLQPPPHPTPLAAAALSSAPGLGETLQGPSSALEGPRLPLWKVRQVGEGRNPLPQALIK